MMKNQTTSTGKERVIVYIDGFNLYFGMKEGGLRDFKWLDISCLSNVLLKPNQELITIKYFTSRVSQDPEKQKRQSTYIDALSALGAQVIYGQYQNNKEDCHRCGHEWLSPKEKMTDVNIATHLLLDAFQDKYDMAMLISGDSDLVPPVKSIHEHFKNKRVFLAFPPSRHNKSLSLQAKGSMIIGKSKIKNCQLPEELKSQTGYILKKPRQW